MVGVGQDGTEGHEGHADEGLRFCPATRAKALEDAPAHVSVPGNVRRAVGKPMSHDFTRGVPPSRHHGAREG